MSSTTAPARIGRRTTRLSVVIVWIVAILAAIGSALEVFSVIGGRVLLAFGGAEPRLPLTAMPQIVEATLREGTTGYLVDAPFWLRVLGATPAMLYILIALVAALLITRVLRGIAASQPFSSKVRRSLTVLSLVFIIGGVLYGVLDTIAGRTIFEVSSIFGQGDQFPLGADYAGLAVDLPRWPFFMIITGVVSLALSAAFKAGARLEEEADGVV
ncbi:MULTISPECIES: DUF2975 domain-containing protein [unclassified Arthrobacter]|uniref:DUF2975 domain-containing protein n=1 Tax=unclassified Arthrobacter TaxID=235627 RepID=UPI0010570F31|nr:MULTISPECIES: DUF2975 domain-containing protein [unclassified Arthrobacter]